MSKDPPISVFVSTRGFKKIIKHGPNFNTLKKHDVFAIEWSIIQKVLKKTAANKPNTW